MLPHSSEETGSTNSSGSIFAPRGGRLRLRLIIGFLAVALLPFLGISFILTVSGSQSGQETAIRQLRTILNYKQSAILIWAEALKAELGNILLTENTTAETTQDLQRLLLANDPLNPENTSLRDAVRERFHLQLDQSQYYDELIILGTNGIVLVSSNIAREGQPAGRLQTAFEEGLLAPYLAPPFYNEASLRTEIYVSYPIIFQGASARGVLMGRARITVLNNILIETSGLGTTGKTYLVAVEPEEDQTDSTIPPRANLRVLAGLSREEQGLVFESQALAELARSVSGDQSAESNSNTGASMQPVEYTGIDLRSEPVIGNYLYIPTLNAYLLGEQSKAETNRASYAVIAVNASVAISSILIALFLALQITRSIAAPLSELSEIAGEAAINASRSQASKVELSPEDTDSHMQSGYLPVAERLKTFSENWLEDSGISRMPTTPPSEAAPTPALDDEIGQLAGAFSNMTSALSNLVEGLEARVEVRTTELQQRTNYLQASTEVSRATASILDPEELIQRSVEVIGEYFGFYYVGLFLIDEARQWAVLRAGTGEAGRKMLQRRHRLPLGRASMIGWSISNAQPRIAQIAEEDVVRLATPELPETRSEAAIPLRSRGMVIGAISVQSTQVNAFDETILAVLQSMADQLAIAIDNANLFAQSQEALRLERSLYSDQSQTAWSSWLRSRPGSKAFSYRATPAGATRLDMVWHPEMEQAFSQGTTVTSENEGPTESAQPTTSQPEGISSSQPAPAATLAIPITVRGASIGALQLRRAPGDHTKWSDEDIAFLEGITEQLAIALDSARMYAETQRRAEQERLIANLTSRIRASLDVETVIRTAADEIFTTLNQPELPMQSIIVELAPLSAGEELSRSQDDFQVGSSASGSIKPSPVEPSRKPGGQDV